VTHLGGVPGRDVGAGGVDFAEPAGEGHLDAEDEIGFAEALGAGLVDATVAFGGFDHRLALGDGHARRLLGVDILAGAHGQIEARACQRSPVAISTASMSGRVARNSRISG
jgi:hypothetical protein